MITCIDCGKEVKRTAQRQWRCPDCATKAKRERGARYRAENPQRVQEYAAKHRAKRRMERGNPSITCIDCGTEVDRRSSTQKRCADCSKENLRRLWREASARDRSEHPERRREIQASHRARNLQEIRERGRRYYIENSESMNARKARYYIDNREAVLGIGRRHRKENPELQREYQRRAKERDVAIDADRAQLPWTPAEDAVVMSWTESLRELGAVLGRTRTSVQHRRARLRKRAAEQAANNKEVNP